MTFPRISHLTIALFLATAGSAVAADPFCIQAKADLVGQSFTAKMALYDTEIGYEEIYKLERDRDEIHKGARFTVVNLECGKKQIELTLKPIPRGEKVEIYFLLHRLDRARDDAQEVFERMQGLVFEERSGESDPEEGSEGS